LLHIYYAGNKAKAKTIKIKMYMNKKLTIILTIIAACITVLLMSCANGRNQEAPLCGRHIKKYDEKAPKIIRDSQLRTMSMSFGLQNESKNDKSLNGHHNYKITPIENGKYILSSHGAFNDTCIIDKEAMKSIQSLIINYKLAEKNGVTDYTEGIAIPCVVFFAEYQSGEKLNFCLNGFMFTQESTDFARLMQSIIQKYKNIGNN